MEELDFYIAFRERFLCNKKWEDTIIYDSVLREINSGTIKFSCRSESDWKKRLKKDEKLFYTIKNYGYLSQKELGSKKFWDEIRIAIGRNGEYLFVDGRHRVAIAKILGVEEVPVFVTAVHEQYVARSQT